MPFPGCAHLGQLINLSVPQCLENGKIIPTSCFSLLLPGSLRKGIREPTLVSTYYEDPVGQASALSFCR